MARTGLPKKYAKMGFTKGWRAYKAAKKRLKRATTAHKNRSATKRKTAARPNNPHPKRRVNTMAKKRKTIRRRRQGGFMSAETMRIVQNGALIGTGVVATDLTTNNLPVVRNWQNWQKALLQLILGVGGMTLVRQKWAKKLFMGSVVSAPLPFIRDVTQQFRFQNMSGRTLTPSELQALQGHHQYMGRGSHSQYLGRPYNINPRPAMGRPFDINATPAMAKSYRTNAMTGARSQY